MEPHSYYTIIPNDLIEDERLSLGAKHLYAQMARRWAQGGRFSIYTTIATIARETHHDHKNVRGWLGDLAAAGWITQAHPPLESTWIPPKR